jgi:hypothetical protein
MKGILYWFHLRVKLISTCHKDPKMSRVPQLTSIGCSSSKFKRFLRAYSMSGKKLLILCADHLWTKSPIKIYYSLLRQGISKLSS